MVASMKLNPALTVMQLVPELKVGGVERGTIEFALYLRQQGHVPIVVSANGPLVAQLNTAQIQHIDLPVGKKSLQAYKLIKSLRRLFIEHQVDVVHARSRLPAWLAYLALQRIKPEVRPKFVTTLHGLHSISRYSSIMARGDAVIAVSNAAKDYLQKHFARYLRSSPVLIYRGVDEQFKYGHQVDPKWQAQFWQKTARDKGGKTVLMPGRLTTVKGVEHLIPWLASTSHSCKLLLTADKGESNYSQKVQLMLVQHDLADRVIWLGIERQMADLYAAVDLVVSVNNKPESFGRTVLEALTVGTPVVAFDQGGVAEILAAIFPQGRVTAGDELELADRIDAFLTAPPAVPEHAQFSNQSMFKSTLAVYHQLLQNNPDTDKSN